jgi:hypothetical protein
MSDSSGVVTAPPGVQVSPGRETVQVGPNGQNMQGMVFTLTLVNGAQTSVFIPYAVMSDTALVEKTFQDRVNAINGVVGSGG